MDLNSQLLEYDLPPLEYPPTGSPLCKQRCRQRAEKRLDDYQKGKRLEPHAVGIRECQVGECLTEDADVIAIIVTVDCEGDLTEAFQWICEIRNLWPVYIRLRNYMHPNTIRRVRHQWQEEQCEQQRHYIFQALENPGWVPPDDPIPKDCHLYWQYHLGSFDLLLDQHVWEPEERGELFSYILRCHRRKILINIEGTYCRPQNGNWHVATIQKIGNGYQIIETLYGTWRTDDDHWISTPEALSGEILQLGPVRFDVHGKPCDGWMKYTQYSS